VVWNHGGITVGSFRCFFNESFYFSTIYDIGSRIPSAPPVKSTSYATNQVSPEADCLLPFHHGYTKDFGCTARARVLR
jgi:hypothetical protein